MPDVSGEYVMEGYDPGASATMVILSATEKRSMPMPDRSACSAAANSPSKYRAISLVPPMLPINRCGLTVARGASGRSHAQIQSVWLHCVD